MDSFRWILIIIGLVIVAGVYFVSSKGKTRKNLVNNRPLINSKTNQDVLFTEPGSEDEYSFQADEAIEPILDDIPSLEEVSKLENISTHNDIEEQLDVDDLDLAGLFSHASAEPVEVTDRAADLEQTEKPIKSPYLLNGSIIAFHVKPRQKESLWGSDVLNTLTEYNIQYGDMKVFHYAVDGENLFSILNMVEPGSFEISRLTAQQIPGLTAIMQLDGIEEKELGFNTMIKKLGEIADVLDASIFDSQHEILTNQTLDAIRSAVADYAK